MRRSGGSPSTARRPGLSSLSIATVSSVTPATTWKRFGVVGVVVVVVSFQALMKNNKQLLSRRRPIDWARSHQMRTLRIRFIRNTFQVRPAATI